MSIFSTQNFSELRSLFAQYDENGDGFINHEEMRNVLAAFNDLHPDQLPERVIDNVMQAADKDGDGKVDFYEFVGEVVFRGGDEVRERGTDEEDIVKAFHLFDEDSSGSIDRTELLNAMKVLGISANEEQVKQMAQELDSDENGLLSIDEFKQLLVNFQ